MIKEKKIPIQWRTIQVLCCDNCQEEMNFIQSRIGVEEGSYYYECPACGLRIISPEPLEAS